jgi:NAD(P)H-dependent flavin oxidoreductase YrpB (nitropropane dioxygenase family)
MIGHPKHVKHVVASGVDILCAQGGEGGGHTGPVPFSVLIPAVVTEARGQLSSLGKQVIVVAAGGVFDGRSLAASLMYGAEGVWVGTRFVASVEAAAPQAHKNEVVSAGWGEMTTTLIYSGRPLRVKKTAYVAEWNDTRADEIEVLTSKGVVPFHHDMEKNPKRMIEGRPLIMGEVAARIDSIPTAKEIVEGMVKGAVEAIQKNAARL